MSEALGWGITDDEFKIISAMWKEINRCNYHQTDELLERSCEVMKGLLRAKKVTWLSVTRIENVNDAVSMNLFEKWWIREIVKFPCDGGQHPEVVKAFLKLAKKYGVGEDTKDVISMAGEHRVHLRQDTFSDEVWRDHWKSKDFNIPHLKINERCHAVYNITPDAESYLLIDRGVDDPAFDEKDRDVALLAISGMGTLFYKLSMQRGHLSPANKSLSVKQRELFNLIHTDLSVKEIADKLEIGVGTVQQQLQTIYQIFQVKGRIELMSIT